jgi:LacI family transcriptional regulator
LTPRVTLADVAAKAGLSPTAASLIMNGRSGTGLSEEARRRVLAAAKELGYRPNLMARGLRTERSATLGFVSDRIASTRYAGPMIRGALRAARDRDHTLFVTETEGDPDEQGRAVDALLDRGVDALIIASVTGRVDLPEERPGLPVVLLNGADLSNAYVSVLPDEVGGGRQAAEHLIGLGHRRVHVLGVPADLDDEDEVTVQVRRRVGSLFGVFARAGVETVPIHGESMTWDVEVGYEAANHALRTDPDLRAVVALNDGLAAGAYEAFRHAGRRIPDDVSIVSFDDDDVVSFLRPQLTTVALPFEAMGRRAVELALSGGMADEYLEPMHLKVRGSTAPALREP